MSMQTPDAKLLHLIGDITAKVDDDTAAVILELARALTTSPIGVDDGYVAWARWLLEERCNATNAKNAKNATNAKTVVIDGSPQFHEFIAGLNEGQW